MEIILKINKMAEFIRKATGFSGKTAVVLGSGLGEFADGLEAKKRVSYADIPDYPLTTVPGHSGELVSGMLKGKQILAAKGRFHYYEGHDWDTLIFPIRLFHQLKVETLIITNSSGSMRRSIKPGSLFLITSYLDCTFRNSPQDPQVINVSDLSPKIYNTVETVSEDQNYVLKRGNYCWALGPSYETPAEIKYFRSLGGDVVGMSTVPEMMEAKKLGMNVLGISCVTNFGAGLSKVPLHHNEVLETAEKVKDDFIKLLSEIIKKG